MFTYFTCERYSCTMQRRHCITRMTRRKGGRSTFHTYHEGCIGCEQGRQNAIECGVLVPAVSKGKPRSMRKLIDELAVTP